MRLKPATIWAVGMKLLQRQVLFSTCLTLLSMNINRKQYFKSEDYSGIKTLEKVYGKPIEDLQKDWLLWYDNQSLADKLCKGYCGKDLSCGTK